MKKNPTGLEKLKDPEELKMCIENWSNKFNERKERERKEKVSEYQRKRKREEVLNALADYIIDNNLEELLK